MTMPASCLCQQDIIWAAFIEIRFLGILEKLGKIQRVHHFQTKMINFWTIFELGSDISSDLSVELPSRNWLNLITGSVLWAYRRRKTRTIIPLLMDWVFDVVDASLTRSLNGTRFHGTTFGTSNLIVIQRSLFASWNLTWPRDINSLMLKTTKVYLIWYPCWFKNPNCWCFRLVLWITQSVIVKFLIWHLKRWNYRVVLLKKCVESWRNR